MASPCFKDITGFDDRKIMLVGIPLASLMISLLLFGEQILAGQWRFLAVCFPMSLIYTAVYWYALRFSYSRLTLRFPGVENLSRRLGWMFLAFLLVFLAVDFSMDAIFKVLLKYGKDHEPPFLLTFISSFLLSALVIATYEAITFYLRLEKSEAEKSELETHYVQSQLDSLRNQVNPHFLFNSLNTLVYLIPENPEKAVGFVRQLSKVYRYVLESREANLIPLAEELEFLQSYIFLQKERFGENFRVEMPQITNSPITNHQIVPLTLQMLFENAIKHNIISTEKPLTVEVFFEKGKLVVRNNLQPKNQVSDSTGVGLENIRNRYRILSGKEVETIVSQQFFTVLLPNLTNLSK